jgi:pimeloyl-ACP methyl ester carboxylesterase
MRSRKALWLALVAMGWGGAYAADVPVPPETALRAMIRQFAEYRACRLTAPAAAVRPSFDYPPLSKTAAAQWRAALWQAWVAHVRDTRASAVRELGDPLKTGKGVVEVMAFAETGPARPTAMRYVLRAFGAKPESGWPLFINLHSGGDDAKLNERSWKLTFAQYPIKTGLYLCPRSVVDTAESWYDPSNYALFERLLVEAYALWDVDPDRVYIMGYSMGGWGTFHLGPSLPDYWAAVAATAGAGFIGASGRSAPDNLRNTPMLIQVGANDHAFGRAARSRQFAERLEELHKIDPGGYIVKFRQHKGKGHLVNDRDTPGWLAGFRRNPLPDRVVWQQIVPLLGVTLDKIDGLRQAQPGFGEYFRPRCYWLRNETPGPFQRIVAARNGQEIRLEETKFVGRITLMLDDRMLDLDRPVRVMAGAKALQEARVPRSVNALVATLVERGDPRLVFPAELTVAVPDMAAELEHRILTSADAYQERALYRLAHGNLDGARADLEGGLKVSSREDRPHLLAPLYKVAELKKNGDLQRDVLERWIEAEPASARLHAAYATALLGGAADPGQTDKAVTHARKAVELTGRKDPVILSLLAKALFRNKEPEKAAATMRQAMQILPANIAPQDKAQWARALKGYEAAMKK